MKRSSRYRQKSLFLLLSFISSSRCGGNVRKGLWPFPADHTEFGEEIQSATGLRTPHLGYSATSANSPNYAMTEDDKATGLDHTWFRKLENNAGRWTSPDPYNGSASIGDPQRFNRYAYVNGDPVNFVDPSGLNRAYCEWRWVIPVTCTDSECGYDWSRAGWAYVCTESRGGASDNGRLVSFPFCTFTMVSARKHSCNWIAFNHRGGAEPY
ncbi:MAG: RHS repeat-associated core domain-containing protein [Pyrinomonadaceae bacterium]